MKTIPELKDELMRYSEAETSWFKWYHSIEWIKAIKSFLKNHDPSPEDDYLEANYCNHYKELAPKKILSDFFRSSLDEVRLKKANDFAEYALYLADKRSYAYFRHVGSRKEISGQIDYSKHRDHAVHTVYNYLLGWYIFEHSDALQIAFYGRIVRILGRSLEALSEREKLFYNSNEGNVFKIKACSYRVSGVFHDKDYAFITSLVNNFADLWCTASLLHDIGYILEGSLSSASPEIEHANIINGAKVLHDYFNHFAWWRLKVDFRAARRIAERVGCKVPKLKNIRSLPSLSDHLRDAGFLENTRKNADGAAAHTGFAPKDDFGLNLEAFALWMKLYENYDFNNSASSNSKPLNILKAVMHEYKHDVWLGDKNSNRTLNHGVCGGLILLQAISFWSDFYFSLKCFKWKEKPEDSSLEMVSEEMYKEIRERIRNTRIPAHIKLRAKIPLNVGGSEVDYFSYTDWIKDLWATAAVSIHDYVGMNTWNACKDESLYLSHSKDPIAYLGVMVDVLQEWDRYSISGVSAFSDDDRLQSFEVKLGYQDNIDKVALYYPKRTDGKSFLEDIYGVFKSCLPDWHHHIEIKQFEINQVDDKVAISKLTSNGSISPLNENELALIIGEP